VTGPLYERTQALLTVVDASSRVRLVLANIPGLLYRISTPAGAGLAPRVSRRAGLVRTTLVPTGDDGPNEVRIVLNRAVRWDIRLPAGAGEQQLDLARGHVTRLDVGPSGLVEMRLSEPRGSVPLTLTGGVGTLIIRVPRGVTLRLALNKDAPPAPDRYVLHARSSVGGLTVRRTDGH